MPKHVEEDRKLFARGRELAERYQQYFENILREDRILLRILPGPSPI